MKRAAIYARFSSDLQRDKSIDDQVALCREACARAGLAVVAVFHDRAISGASTKNRPGFQAMMRAAEARAFDVLIAEDVDRIARDQGDYHNARRDLAFAGVEIHSPQGLISKIDGSLRALMGELYLENLADKVRRGLRGVLRDGRHAGGRAYGYRPVPGKPGELAIDAGEAEIVREIFTRYAKGETPRRIARDLNARAVPAPRGGQWNASTINGNHKRSSGMLFNELYVGRIVWNRLRWLKDPATGKRVSRGNASDQLVTAAAPQLRILDDALWSAARMVKAAKHHAIASHSRRPARLLSGLIKCGSCGAGMSACSRDRKGMRLQCSAHRERGTCGNGRLVYRAAVEAAVVAGLRDLLADRAGMADYVRIYNEERRRLAQGQDAERGRLTRRVGEIAREIERLIDAIAKEGAPAAPLAPRLKALDAERAQISDRLAAPAGAQVIALHPAAVDQYRANLEGLAAILAATAGEQIDALTAERHAALIDIVRRLIAAVAVHAEPGRGAIRLEVKGRLAELAGEAFQNRSTSGGMVVAGVGFEPTTFRL